MPRVRCWSDLNLKKCVAESRSIRATLLCLGLVPAGGNYQQVSKAISDLDLDLSHFTGKGWRRDCTFSYSARQELQAVLTKDSRIQSYKLKKRLFHEKMKVAKCELCGWAKRAPDGRIPVELDHINGDRFDNRIENLRILCPNCHSLQHTHRGMNQKRRGGGIGRHATLKMS